MIGVLVHQLTSIPSSVFRVLDFAQVMAQHHLPVDDQTLDSLRSALAASPDNEHLLGVLLTAYLERQESARALALLQEIAVITETKTRVTAGRVCLAAGEPGRALELLTGHDPEEQLTKARALAALGRKSEALEIYRKVVEANPTLEDRAFETELCARDVEVEQGGEVRRLRVISNDDTNESELNRLLMPAEEKVTFEQVGGLEDLKKQIKKKIILPFQKPSLFQRYKKKVGGGILLYGAPGCGKTLLARATAGEVDATFFNIAISDVLDMYIGESEQKLHALFEKARQSAPAVLFFDELEALGGKRQYTRELTASKIVSQFLAEMDGFAQNNHGVLILGATNVPWAVDPAFRRPGRFDRVVFVPPPDQKAREEILRIHLKERPTEGDLGLAEIAKKTSGFSGADLQNIVESTIDEAIEESLESEREVPLMRHHLLSALGNVKPTTREWLTTARNYARYANESGQYDEVLEFLGRHGK